MKAGTTPQLRALSAVDAAALWAAMSASRDALKKRFSWPDDALARERCSDFIARAARDEKDGRALVRGAFAGKDGVLIGVAALQHLDETPGIGEASLWVRSEMEGRGRATELAKAVIDLAFKKRGLRRLYCRIDPANRGARKVAQKAGFRYEGRLRKHKRLNGRWIDQECWGLLKEEA